MSESESVDFLKPIDSTFGYSRGVKFLAYCFIIFSTLHYYRCAWFTHWFIDELPAVSRNPLVADDRNFLDILTHDFWGAHLWEVERATHKSWRPVTTLIFRFIARTEKAVLAYYNLEPLVSPFWFRLFGCFSHTLASCLVLKVSLDILRVPLIASCFGALWFAVHSVHVENIVYIVGIADILATVFGLMAVISNTSPQRSRESQHGWTTPLKAIGWIILSALSKESGFTYFGVVTVQSFVKEGWSPRVRVFLVSLVVTVCFRIWYVGGAPVNFAYADVPIIYEPERYVRFLSYLQYHWHYMKLLVLPWYQSWDYSFDAIPLVRGLDDLRMVGSLTAYLGIVSLAYCCSKTRIGILSFSLFILPAIPASSLFMAVGTVVGERLMYPVSAGLALILSSTLFMRRSSAFRLGLVPYLGVMMYLCYDRLGVWRSKHVLYGEDAINWPRSCKTLHQFGAVLLSSGQGGQPLAPDDEAYIKDKELIWSKHNRHLEKKSHAFSEYFLLKSLEIFDDNAVTDYLIGQIAIDRALAVERENRPSSINSNFKVPNLPGQRCFGKQPCMDLLIPAYDRFIKIVNGHGIGFTDFSRFMFLVDYGWLLIKVANQEESKSESQFEAIIHEGLSIFKFVGYAWNAIGVSALSRGAVGVAGDAITKAIEIDGQWKWQVWSNGACVALKWNERGTANFWLEQSRVILNRMAGSINRGGDGKLVRQFQEEVYFGNSVVEYNQRIVNGESDKNCITQLYWERMG